MAIGLCVFPRSLSGAGDVCGVRVVCGARVVCGS